MRVFQDEQFDSFRDRDSGAHFCDLEFRKCYFESCSLSITQKPSLRTVVSNVKLINCVQRGCTLNSAIVENCLIDGLKTNGQLLQTWGAAFNKVILRGKIDRLMISSAVLPGVIGPEEQYAFDEANSEFYRKVEWALDISEGDFKELCIRGLPGHLIRRDPETQVQLTREKALSRRWQDLTLNENTWHVSLDMFLQRAEPSIVLVAPKRHPRFRNYVEDLMVLRDSGVAEPD